jgi:hypothetical protein
MSNTAETASRRPAPRTLVVAAARLAPWLIFGPITGVLSEAALASFRRGQKPLGVAYIALNIVILVALPLTTALLAAHLPAR